MDRDISVRGWGPWLCALVLAFAHAGQAQPFDVTSTGDGGDGTLRTAVDDANGNAGSDTVTFTFSGANNTISLLTPLAPITPGELILDGTGDDVTIDGSGNMDPFLEVRENVEVIDIALTNGTVLISADRILTLDMPQNLTSTAGIDGTGGVTKEGAGILFLTGDLDYTGTTTITEGTLDLSSVVQGDIEIETSGTLAFGIAAGDTETFGGALSGAGTLIKNGPGTLVLSGANTSTGSIALNLGTLEGSSSSIAGDVAVEDTTTLVFAQNFDGTYAGNLSSPVTTATVVKQGTGNLRLSGDNSAFMGALQLDAGAVTGDVASLPGSIQNAATLVFDQASDAEYMGSITGAGALQKTGDGTLTFSTQTYTGPTTISGGRLDIAAGESLASEISVDSGGALGGNGTITAPVTVNGRVAPGPNVGTLTIANPVANPVDFNPGSVLEVEITAQDVSDKLAVTNDVQIQDGARIDLRFDNLAGLMNTGDSVSSTILTTGGFVGAGQFNPPKNFAFQTIDLDPIGNELKVTVTLDGVKAGGITPNQQTVASVLEIARMDPGIDPALGDAISTLLTSSLNVAAGARALDEIGPEALSQFNTARLALAQRLGDSAQQRVRHVFAGGGKPLFARLQSAGSTLVASAPPTPSLGGFGARTGFGTRQRHAQITTRGGLRSFEPEAGSMGLGGWLDGYGGFGTLDGDSGTADADYILAGATLGLDYRLTPNVLAGVGGGWGFTDLEVDDRSADGEAHTFHALAYTGYATPEFHLGLSGHYALSELETSRRIRFATFAETADGDFDGEAYGGRLEAGVNVAQLYGVLFQPIAHFDLSHIEQDGYRESGSPAFNLNVASESIDSQISSVGLRIHGAWALPEDSGSFEPEITGRWEHQFGDDEREITGTLLGDASGTPIALRGADAPTDRYVVHIGWVVASEMGLRTTLGYTGAFASEQMEHAGALSLEYSW